MAASFEVGGPNECYLNPVKAVLADGGQQAEMAGTEVCGPEESIDAKLHGSLLLWIFS